MHSAYRTEEKSKDGGADDVKKWLLMLQASCSQTQVIKYWHFEFPRATWGLVCAVTVLFRQSLVVFHSANGCFSQVFHNDMPLWQV